MGIGTETVMGRYGETGEPLAGLNCKLQITTVPLRNGYFDLTIYKPIGYDKL